MILQQLWFWGKLGFSFSRDGNDRRLNRLIDFRIMTDFKVMVDQLQYRGRLREIWEFDLLPGYKQGIQRFEPNRGLTGQSKELLILLNIN